MGSMLFIDLLPLIIFVIVDIFAGLKWGVGSAIVAVMAAGIWEYSRFGEIDSLTWITATLIVVLGGVSLYLKNSMYFKLQPAIVSVAAALVVAYYQWFDTPIMVHIMPKMIPLLPPAQQELFNTPQMMERMAQVSGQLIWLLAINAVILTWAAFKWSNVKWIVARGTTIYVMMIALVVFDTLVLWN